MAFAIQFENISKSFKEHGKKFFALKDVNFSVREGEIFALVGPNGSGKTTLINILFTLLRPDEGTVKIKEKNPFENPEILKQINLLPSERFIHSHLTVIDFLLAFAKFYGASRQKLESLVKEFDVSNFAKKEWWTLSLGEETRCLFVRALLNSPTLLVLDEPTAGLDPKTALYVREKLLKLNSHGMTIFFTSHDMQVVANLAHRVAFIKRGQILNIKSVRFIKKKFGTLEKYWLSLAK